MLPTRYLVFGFLSFIILETAFEITELGDIFIAPPAFEIDSILPPLFWGINLGSDAANILKQLNNDRSFYLLNHQSLDSKLAKHTTIEAMANYYLQKIQVPQKRFAFFAKIVFSLINY